MTLAQLTASLATALSLLANLHAAPPQHPPFSAVAPAVRALDARLAVDTSTYAVAAGESVFDAMRALASTTRFRFSYREYPGLGAFVTSINDTPNGNGRYWILWLNGAQAPLGASSLILRAGDRAEWRYEQEY